MERFQQQLDSGKDSSGKPLTAEDREDLQNAAGRRQRGQRRDPLEFRDLKVRVPDVTFDRELDIDLEHREAQLKFLGRGNTAGDAIAYLPNEKIVIAGDLVDSPVPYLGSGFPSEQIVTLKRMADLDFDTLVPGHGDVLKGKSFLQQEIAFLQVVVAAMNDEIGRDQRPPGETTRGDQESRRTACGREGVEAEVRWRQSERTRFLRQLRVARRD